jgi:glycosyltransferase involved in cell wall biosynthesis
LGPYKGKQLFHPVYAQFGELIPRAEAEKALGLTSGKKNLLFFGLIRKYKGLDILIKAFGLLPEEYQLIIAGEPYGGFEEYAALIDESPAKERIHCFLSYIADDEVKKFFSAADLSVLPYRSASQSGVIAVSYNFGVPMVVTDAGSLRQETEEAGTGIVAKKIEPEAMADAIKEFFGTAGLQQKCKQNIIKESDRLSWTGFCKALLDYADKL